MASTPKPAVLLISLSYIVLNHHTSAHLLAALHSSFFVLQAETPNTASAFLEWPNLKAVILGDADLTRKKYPELHRKVVE